MCRGTFPCAWSLCCIWLPPSQTLQCLTWSTGRTNRHRVVARHPIVDDTFKALLHAGHPGMPQFHYLRRYWRRHINRESREAPEPEGHVLPFRCRDRRDLTAGQPGQAGVLTTVLEQAALACVSRPRFRGPTHVGARRPSPHHRPTQESGCRSRSARLTLSPHVTGDELVTGPGLQLSESFSIAPAPPAACRATSRTPKITGALEGITSRHLVRPSHLV
ncbi:uncharacterized protein B0T15DRAFT_160987 [Chaetomium strumarium]|uniref:Secreted protein n=1 Tax=Chaetomium strumarium TaxID=1170767 RepID=A0AAJ0GW80_9PEZI|nr:hypothetical protein B0T15DRAFT_160987 [Chaetomium strumarium]